MQHTITKQIAIGGILAALAVVIMCLVGMIPVATYVCPMLCAVLCYFVLRLSTARIAWCWYLAVAILSLLFAPDKEAAFVFLLLGYYPIIKQKIDRSRFRWFLKLLFFNSSILIGYSMFLKLIGIEQIMQEYREFGIVGLCVLVIMGNVCFCLLDLLLERIRKRVGR